jgi:hypothetical protein
MGKRTYVVSERIPGAVISLVASATDRLQTHWRFRVQNSDRKVYEFSDSTPNGAYDKLVSFANEDKVIARAGAKLLYKMAACII